MRRPLLALSLLLLTTTAFAQPFQRSMGTFINERANCIEHTTDGGYIIAGTDKELSDV